MRFWRLSRLGGIGAFATGILAVIQGCTEREGALAAVLLLLLQTCSPNVDLYWVDNNLAEIHRVNETGLGQVTLVCDSDHCNFKDTTICCPHDIALDQDEGKMYWVDTGSSTIKRANLNGSNIEVLVCAPGFTAFTGVDCFHEDPDVESPNAIELDLVHRKMYWVDDFTTVIMRADLNGGNREILLCNPLFPPVGACAFEDQTLTDLESIALDLIGDQMYWSDKFTNRIRRASTAGAGSVDLVCGPGPGAFPGCSAGVIPDMAGVEDIALDLVNKKIYWVDGTSERILRANLDGSNIERILCSVPIDCPDGIVIDDLDHPQGIALDVFSGIMYWIDSGSDRIKRANLDGTNVQNILCDADPCPGGVLSGFNISVPEALVLGH